MSLQASLSQGSSSSGLKKYVSQRLSPEDMEFAKRFLGRELSELEQSILCHCWSEPVSGRSVRNLLRQLPADREEPLDGFGEVLRSSYEGEPGVVSLGGGMRAHLSCSTRTSFESPSGLEVSRGVWSISAGSLLASGSQPLATLGSCRIGKPLGNFDISSLGLPLFWRDVCVDPAFGERPVIGATGLGISYLDTAAGRVSAPPGSPIYLFGAKEVNADTVAGVSNLLSMSEVLCHGASVARMMPQLAACRLALAAGCGVDVMIDQFFSVDFKVPFWDLVFLAVVAPDKREAFETAVQGEGLRCGVVGRTDAEPVVRIRMMTFDSSARDGELCAQLPLSLLREDAPAIKREAIVPAYFAQVASWTAEEAGLPDLDQAALEGILPLLLKAATSSSLRLTQPGHRSLSEGSLAVEDKSDAPVFRVEGEGGSRVLALDARGNTRYLFLNPRRGAQLALVQALRRLACSGASPLGAACSLNFGDSSNPGAHYQLREVLRGLGEACRSLDIPMLSSGLCQRENPVDGTPAVPAPVLSVLGMVHEGSRVTTCCVQQAGLKLVLLGVALNELGGSLYLESVHDLKTGDAPAVDLAVEERVNKTVRTLIGAGLVRAAHGVYEGGLLPAAVHMLCEKARGLGLSLDLSGHSAQRVDTLVFGESQGRVLLAVEPAQLGRIISESHMQGVPASVIGEVVAEPRLSLKIRQFSVSWSLDGLFVTI